MRSDRLFNMFGALALAATDAIRRGAETDVAFGGETAAALNLIGHVREINIDGLATGLGLSHPGTVRLVDRLVRAGLALREPSANDRRAVELRLTAGGKRLRKKVMSRRRHAMDDLLAPLSIEERSQLEAAVSKLLYAHVVTERDALGTCRFCDERACAECPVNAALVNVA